MIGIPGAAWSAWNLPWRRLMRQTARSGAHPPGRPGQPASAPVTARRRLPAAVAAGWRAVARRAGPRLPTPRRTPFTFWYLAVLLVSTIVLRSVRPETAYQVLAWSSTNVTELSRHPVEVLIVSALWLPGLVWTPYAVIYTVVLAPVERVVGGRWTALVFASGHVIATLATQLPVALLIRFGHLGRSWADVIDVGVSYGLYTTGGMLLGMLVPRRRLLLLLLTEAGSIAWFAAAPDVSGAGHLIALNLGLLWWRWLAGRGLLGALATRLPRPAVVEVRPVEMAGSR